jgi:hypothetical protein
MPVKPHTPHRALFFEALVNFLRERHDPRLIEAKNGDVVILAVGLACAEFCIYMDQHPELSTPELEAGASEVADELTSSEMGEAGPTVH